MGEVGKYMWMNEGHHYKMMRFKGAISSTLMRWKKNIANSWLVEPATQKAGLIVTVGGGVGGVIVTLKELLYPRPKKEDPIQKKLSDIEVLLKEIDRSKKENAATLGRIGQKVNQLQQNNTSKTSWKRYLGL